MYRVAQTQKIDPRGKPLIVGEAISANDDVACEMAVKGQVPRLATIGIGERRYVGSPRQIGQCRQLALLFVGHAGEIDGPNRKKQCEKCGCRERDFLSSALG